MKTKLLIAVILLFGANTFAQIETNEKENQQETTLFNKGGTRGLDEPEKLTKAEEAKLFSAKEGTFTDFRDGKNYRWIKINGQIWMAENLAYMPEVYSPDETNGGYWVYDSKTKYVQKAKEQANYETFGVLYNYQTAYRACPPGWRLPMDYDWRKLEAYLGFGREDLMKKGSRGHSSELIKSDRVWGATGENTNKLGFSAIPSGLYNPKNKKFEELGRTSTYWSLEIRGNQVWCRTLSSKNATIERYDLSKEFGFSIRCIKE